MWVFGQCFDATTFSILPISYSSSFKFPIFLLAAGTEQFPFG